MAEAASDLIGMQGVNYKVLEEGRFIGLLVGLVE
jgi:hypothetical protein